MRIAVLAGGIGGARFLRGVRAACPDDEITAVVNTGDDVTLHGLRICPDLDSVMYTLGGAHDAERGWGRAGETWRIKDELTAYGAEPSWFGARRPRHRHPPRPHPDARRRLPAVSDVTAALCDAVAAGRHAAADDRRARARRTSIVDDPGRPARAAGDPLPGVVGAAPRRAARRRRSCRSASTTPSPRPGVARGDRRAPTSSCSRRATRWCRSARSSACPGIREASASGAGAGRRASRRSSAARRCAAWPTPACRPSASRSAPRASAGTTARAADGGLLDGWLVARHRRRADVPGVEVRAVPLLMTDDDATAAMVRAALELAA